MEVGLEQRDAAPPIVLALVSEHPLDHDWLHVEFDFVQSVHPPIDVNLRAIGNALFHLLQVTLRSNLCEEANGQLT